MHVIYIYLNILINIFYIKLINIFLHIIYYRLYIFISAQFSLGLFICMNKLGFVCLFFIKSRYSLKYI